MKRELEKWSLVVAGQWNTAILSPGWLAKEFFKEAEVKIMYPVLGGGPPVFEAAEIRVVVAGDRVAFVPLKDDLVLLNRIESGAKHILETLRYTPVSAFGENFHYIDDSPPRQLKDAIDRVGADKLGTQGTVLETALRRSLELEGRRLNLTISSGDAFRIELNYHYDVSDAKQAAERIENTYAPNHEHGLALLESAYELVLDEGIG
jgi:hypothetical protein